MRISVRSLKRLLREANNPIRDELFAEAVRVIRAYSKRAGLSIKEMLGDPSIAALELADTMRYVDTGELEELHHQLRYTDSQTWKSAVASARSHVAPLKKTGLFQRSSGVSEEHLASYVVDMIQAAAGYALAREQMDSTNNI